MARCLLHAKETFVVVIREIFCDFVTRETFGETCRIPARLERKKRGWNHKRDKTALGHFIKTATQQIYFHTRKLYPVE